MKHIHSLQVFFNKDLVGSLHSNQKNEIYFTYDTSWLQKGFNLSPFDLSLDNKPQKAKDVTLFGGLHGVFADSISDGWGLLLTDRVLQQTYGWSKSSITQLDRLFFMGSRTMGGLSYFPTSSLKFSDDDINFCHLFLENQKILQGEKDEVISSLYLHGGSPGGARPKALFSTNGQKIISGNDQILPGYNAWIIKFFSEIDTVSTGKIEKAYSDMAFDYGISMMETKLIDVNVNAKNISFFATQRFDRNHNHRIHTASLSGLLYASHRIPSIDYETILSLTQQLCKNQSEVERAFDLMLFNIIMHNKDDHSKNFSYIYNNNQWSLSPAYDLTFSNSFNGQHMSAVNGHGNPRIKEILKIAKDFKIINPQHKIDNLLAISANWNTYASRYNIPKKEKNDIHKSLTEIRSDFQ